MNVIPALPQDPIDTQDELVDHLNSSEMGISQKDLGIIEQPSVSESRQKEPNKVSPNHLQNVITKRSVEDNLIRQNGQETARLGLLVEAKGTVMRAQAAAFNRSVDMIHAVSHFAKEHKYTLAGGVVGGAIALAASIANVELPAGVGPEMITRLAATGAGAVGALDRQEHRLRNAVIGGVTGATIYEGAHAGLAHLAGDSAGIRTVSMGADDPFTMAGSAIVMSKQEQIQGGVNKVIGTIGKGAKRLYSDAKAAFNPFRGGDGGGALPVKGESITSKVGSPAFNGVL